MVVSVLIGNLVFFSLVFCSVIMFGCVLVSYWVRCGRCMLSELMF